jgi:hypothetical protein
LGVNPLRKALISSESPDLANFGLRKIAEDVAAGFTEGLSERTVEGGQRCALTHGEFEVSGIIGGELVGPGYGENAELCVRDRGQILVDPKGTEIV